MHREPLPWSEGARNAIEAMRTVTDHDGSLVVFSALRVILFETPVGACLLSYVLREHGIWPSLHSRTAYGPGDSRMLISEPLLELNVQYTAQQEGALQIGERHIAHQLVTDASDELVRLGVNTGLLEERVRLFELGPPFTEQELVGWHGLLDANVLIQGHDLNHIRWLEEAGSTPVVLWIGNSLLDEMDYLQSQGASKRVRSRSRHFIKDLLLPWVDAALKPEGAEIRPGEPVRLRVWPAVVTTGFRDTDHLDTALELRYRGVPLRIITWDGGVLVRAKARGIPVHMPSETWRLPDATPGP